MTTEDAVLLIAFLGVAYLIWRGAADIHQSTNSPLTGGLFLANPNNASPIGSPDPYTMVPTAEVT